MFLCKTKKAPRGVIYWLPHDTAVSDFVNTKVDPLIRDNSDKINTETEFKQIQNQGLKFLWGVPTFWRGLKSKTAVKSISADAAIYDEFDEADQDQVTQARQRLSFSDVRLERELSTPTLPDFGIDKQFQDTDQCYYAFKCDHCSSWNILEDLFPKCFAPQLDGTWKLICNRCKKDLQTRSGQWVQKESKNKIRGYQISQLYSPFKSPTEIMNDYNTTEFMGHFHNHVLGLPYLSAEDRITSEMVLNLCEPLRIMPATCREKTVCGVDVGSKLHCTIMRPGTPNKIIWVGELIHFEELDTLMLKFNVSDLVIDALPETRKVRELIGRHKNKVWACFYNDNQKGSFAWKEDERIVSVNRTESLDVGTQGIINKLYTFPQRNPMLEKFAAHCEAVAKVAEKDKETGSIKYRYRHLSADHFRHSFNYACIAASRQRTGSIISTFR